MMALFGLIGNPAGHSLSPIIHSVTCNLLGLPHRYVAVEVASQSEVKGVLQALHSLGFLGLNVTIPYKEEAHRCAVERSPDADAIGAVNVLVRSEKGWEGHNTDWVAVAEALSERGASGLGRCVLVGAGGAARAAAYAVARIGASELLISNRSESRGLELLKLCEERFGVRARFVPLQRLRSEVAGAELIINAIPAGLTRNVEFPLRSEEMKKVRYLVDLVYSRAGDPPATRAGKDAGCEVIDGIEVLARQAAHSLKLWTGVDPGFRLMESIARASVGWHG